MALADILARHRGPYRFQVCRATDAPDVYASQNLDQQYEPEEVLAAAKTLLGDMKDTVTAVSVWSETEEVFVTTITPLDCD